MLAEPAKTLASRTFIGLLLAQFTATFNDQAIHMVAIFYASDMLVRFVRLSGVDEKAVISLVTACFILPFLFFSPLSGQLSDRYGKKGIIVFWKIAEVVMMLIAMTGLMLPHFAGSLGVSLENVCVVSALMVAGSVFLMGTHSTFFVPAKYGIMPEILHPSILSRGNGLLEGTSFMAQIFGTSVGGLLYAMLKGPVEPGSYTPGNEWMIGALLLGLAVIGTLTAIVMDSVPVAAPDRVVTWNWWKPLRENLAILWGSKQLTFAVIGIAFCAFMTLFLRQSLLYEAELGKELRLLRAEAQEHRDAARKMSVAAAGEQVAAGENAAGENAGIRDNAVARDLAANQPADLTARELTPAQRRFASADRFWEQIIPPWLVKGNQQAELRIALLIALVGFGVGIGSVCAGFMSGPRVELGMVPVGAALLVLLMFCTAFLLQAEETIVLFLFLIGIAAGPYIVPLYTLLQYRAPKKSKGNVIAASNFLNVAAGVAAAVVFFTVTFMLETVYRPRFRLSTTATAEELESYALQLENTLRVPQILFVCISFFTIVTVIVLWRRQPDFFIRAGVWLASLFRPRSRIVGTELIPAEGPVVFATDCNNLRDAMQVLSVTDRLVQLFVVRPSGRGPVRPILNMLSLGSQPMELAADQLGSSSWQSAAKIGLNCLKRGDIVCLNTRWTGGSNGPVSSLAVESVAVGGGVRAGEKVRAVAATGNSIAASASAAAVAGGDHPATEIPAATEMIGQWQSAIKVTVLQVRLTRDKVDRLSIIIGNDAADVQTRL